VQKIHPKPKPRIGSFRCRRRFLRRSESCGCRAGTRDWARELVADWPPKRRLSPRRQRQL